MAEVEVEKTLREIRERVRAESLAVLRAAAASPVVTRDGGAVMPPARDEAAEAIARLEANLATADRARDKLPPLQSNRDGMVARLELWVKRKIKRAAHWFTWEQVNFNSAAYHALADALAALRVQRQTLSELRDETRAELARVGELHARLEEQYARLEERQAKLEARHAKLEDRVNADAARAREERVELAAGVERLRDEARASAEQLRVERRESAEQLRDEVRDEMRERASHLLEEQRVCYTQLSLESSEAAVMFDRARRDLEARLAEIEKAVTSDK